MQFVDAHSKISVAELEKMSKTRFGDLVKAVVDIEKKVMVVDAGMHSDQEALLLESDSQQGDLWGINIYPEHIGTDGFIVFDSMINLRPSWGNNSRGVDNPMTQVQIKDVVNMLVTR